MARRPRRELAEQEDGLPLYRKTAPPRQEPEPTGWSSTKEDETFEDEDEDEDLEETEHEILLDDDFSGVSEQTDDDEDSL